MSLLAPEVHAELEQLLQALQSPDNTVRAQAEEHLQNNWTNTRPEVLLLALAEQIGASTNSQVGSSQLRRGGRCKCCANNALRRALSRP
jgi:importin-5